MTYKFGTYQRFIILSLTIAFAFGPVKSTEDIDGHSDLSLEEAKQSMLRRDEWVEKYLKYTEWKNFWFVRFSLNLLSYSTVLMPCFLIVILVKRNKNVERPGSGCFIQTLKLFVEGRNFLSMEGMNTYKTGVHSNIEGTFIGQSLSLCLYSVGLLTSYLVWGVVQERVMVYEYKSEDPNIPGKKFTNSQFIVFSNRILAFLVAIVANQLIRQTPHGAPAYKYIYSSFSNIMSSWCQYEALKFVSFPVQVLAKTSKVIPVMLMGKIVSRRSYTCFEYVTASAISAGVFLFLISSEESSQGSHAITSTTISGVIILIGYLLFDSFTANWQDALFNRYKVSSMQMMAGVNFFSVLLTLVSLLEQGTFFPALAFMYQHPLFFFHIFILSITSATGQIFIFATIAKFGPATFTIIMTIRQGLAILLSCIIYGHQVAVSGAFGVAIVFVALFSRIYHKQTLAKNRNRDSAALGSTTSPKPSVPV